MSTKPGEQPDVSPCTNLKNGEKSNYKITHVIIRLTVSWHDSSVIGGPNLYDSNCDAKVIIGLADMARIWTPDVYIYNAMETVCG